MARKKKVAAAKDAPSKTDAIISFVTANPSAGNAEIANALNEKFGWSMSSGYVSTIKSQKGLSSGRRGRKSAKRKIARSARGNGASARGASSSAAGNISLSELVEVKELVDRLGGPEKAKVVIDALAQLRA